MAVNKENNMIWTVRAELTNKATRQNFHTFAERRSEKSWKSAMLAVLNDLDSLGIKLDEFEIVISSKVNVVRSLVEH